MNNNGSIKTDFMNIANNNNNNVLAIEQAQKASMEKAERKKKRIKRAVMLMLAGAITSTALGETWKLIRGSNNIENNFHTEVVRGAGLNYYHSSTNGYCFWKDGGEEVSYADAMIIIRQKCDELGISDVQRAIGARNFNGSNKIVNSTPTLEEKINAELAAYYKYKDEKYNGQNVDYSAEEVKTNAR